jgi:hypothetical protein
MRPAAADVDKLPALGKELNSTAAARSEIKIRSISGGEVGVSAYGASSQIDVGGDMARVKAGIPAQDDGLKSSAVD